MGNKIVLRTHLSTNNVEHQLRRTIDCLARCTKYIKTEIEKSTRGEIEGYNLYGEKQKALDVLADELILNNLEEEESFKIHQFASEEGDNIKTLVEHPEGRYSVTVDPLDGSSLVDVNLAIGTIIGIHDGPLLDGRLGRESLVAAMYTLYGPETSLVYSIGNGVHEFVLNSEGDWILKMDYIKMNEKGKIASFGGLRVDWLPQHRYFAESLEEQRYKPRYSGALVADFNQILMKKGGIFSYPALAKASDGKLRLLFELQPLAFIVEQAGGMATNGLENILDIVTQKLDQRSPIYIGSKFEVNLAKKYLLGQ